MMSKKTFIPLPWARLISCFMSALVPRCGSIWVKSVIQYPWYPALTSAPAPCTGRFLNDGVSQMDVVPRDLM